MHSLRMRSFAWYWLPVLAYAGLIYRLSAIPGSDIPGLFPYQDIVFHFFEYAIFAFLLSRAIRGSSGVKAGRQRMLLVMAVAVTYALSDEFHQLFVPNRTASLFDIFIDSGGSLFAAALYNLRMRNR